MYTKQMQLHKPRNNTKRSKRSLATSIPKNVALDVKVRDRNRCIYCGDMSWIEIHHLIERSLGGMGIEQNLVCLCSVHHKQLHAGNKDIKNVVKKYLEKKYPDFKNEDRIYNKWR